MNYIPDYATEYLFLLLDMWPIFIILFAGMSLIFYGVLMRKTAIACLIACVIVSIVGWSYG